MKWTTEDEAALNALTKRRAAVMEVHRHRLKEVLAQVSAPKFTEDERVDAAMRYADALRDALLPFDSGVRAAQ